LTILPGQAVSLLLLLCFQLKPVQELFNAQAAPFVNQESAVSGTFSIFFFIHHAVMDGGVMMQHV
jgi:hypothetical protein